MAYDDGMPFPLKLDPDSLLHWVNYNLQENPRASIKMYDTINTSEPYQSMSDNTELLKRLRAVLEADVAVREARKSRRFFFTRTAAKIRQIKFFKRKTGLEVHTLVAERQKAYDAYEMLRKLSYQTGEGLEFVLELT
ncbi:hypothetical protein D3C87_796270 [compost metagenome]